MADPASYLALVGTISEALEKLRLTPVLVGGMALVTMGSRRVTRDFDFVVSAPGERLEDLVDVFYSRGLELASRVNDDGEVTATIDNARVAAIRLRLDAPATAYFVSPESGLRVDLLFDYPVPAADLAARASRTTIRSRKFRIASAVDLLELKRIARASRTAPGDAEDIAFLRAKLKADGAERSSD